MKKSFKRAIGVLLTAQIIVSAFAVGTVSASAEVTAQDKPSIVEANATETPASAFEYEITDNEVTITGLKNEGMSGAIVIPSKINGYSVTSIGDWAFWNCSSLTSVTIPNTITSIGGYAFWNCSSLTSVTIPNKVTNIDGGAFDGCSSLTSINIPNSVTTIGKEAFANCSSLKQINVDDNNTQYSSKDGVLFNKDKTTLIQYPMAKNNTSYVIPNSVTTIDFVAFSNCSYLKGVTIPNSVTEICGGAFSDCISLTSISIPNSVTIIDRRAFYNCSSLKMVEIPNSVTAIGVYAFYGCSSLTSVSIPDSVTEIGYNAFENSPNVVLSVYENSYAHNYALENNIPFNLISKVIPGDANNDGVVSVADAVLLQRCIIGLETFTVDQCIACDLNHDNTLNTIDVILMMRNLLGFQTN